MTHQTSARPLRLSRDLRNVPLDKYRLPKEGRKWKTIARQRMALAEWLATHGDADGSRIYPGEKSMTCHFGWSRATTFRLLKDLKKLHLLESKGLTSERGTRVRSMNLSAFLGSGAGVSDSSAAGVSDSSAAGVSDSSAAGVSDSRAGVSGNVRHDRHVTDTKEKPSSPGGDAPCGKVEKPKPAAQDSGQSPSPLSGKRKPRTARQRAATRVWKLIPQAVALVARAREMGASITSADLREELKEWAARNGLEYDSESISKALDVADEKTRAARCA